MTGKEARQILADNKINLAWLAGQMGISPQTLNSRLHAQDFKIMYIMHITSILHKDIFGIGYDELMTKQPIIDLRADIDNASFNRTFMGLKFVITIRQGVGSFGFNRTFMELKCS